MPAVAEYARPTSALVCRIVDTESSLQPQGPEGRQLHLKADEAFQHWGERAEALISEIDHFISDSDQDDDSWTHVPIRPNRVFYVETRYVYAGKGLPLAVHWDDD